MKFNYSPIILIVAVLAFSACSKKSVSHQEQARMLIRCDDIGLNHAVNMAADRMVQSGLPFSASVMFVAPWVQEAVQILKGHANVSIGVHLTLNSEWQGYRWGPITGTGSAGSLVDSNGYFWPTTQQFLDHNPDPDEVESELTAQIKRALQSGLQIDYLDYHMGSAVAIPQLRKIVEELAKKYHLGISRYLGEQTSNGIYSVPPASKVDSLVAIVNSLSKKETALMVFHIGLDTPEMEALKDQNPDGLPNVAANRNAELNALLSYEFANTLEQNQVRLINYKTLINEVGLKKMSRPTTINY